MDDENRVRIMFFEKYKIESMSYSRLNEKLERTKKERGRAMFTRVSGVVY